MGPFKVWLGIAVLAAFDGYSLWFACKAWARSRLIDDTPTSRLRSAAQGYVELCGRGAPAGENPSRGPLTGMPCAWWRYEIQELRSAGRSRRWLTVESATSTEPFILDDGTGRCLVDPSGAEVYPGSTLRWYGPTRWPQGRIPDGTGPLGRLMDHLLIDDYRYTEHRLELGAAVYAIGAFRSLGGVAVGDPEAAVAQVLRTWKGDREALMRRFDTNRDGTLSSSEWERAREAARLEVQGRRAEEERRPTVNVLADPMDGRAFLLAASDGGSLARRFRRRALAGFTAFVAGAALLTWLLEHV